MKILDLGCGLNPRGTVNVDKSKLPGVDLVMDIDKCNLPFKDNEFDGVVMHHSLEHFNNFFKVMEEVHRVTKNEGRIKIWVPYFRHSGSFRPEHKTFFASHTFNTFEPNFDVCNYYSSARFKMIKRRFNFYFLKNSLNFLINLSKYSLLFYEEVLSRFIPAWEIYFELEVVK